MCEGHCLALWGLLNDDKWWSQGMDFSIPFSHEFLILFWLTITYLKYVVILSHSLTNIQFFFWLTITYLKYLVIWFIRRSKVVLLLWIIYVTSVLFCYVFMIVCLLMPCGHLLGKGWPLGSCMWCLIVTLSLSHWYLRSVVVLDCINVWSLPSYFLLYCSMISSRDYFRLRRVVAFSSKSIKIKHYWL